MGRERTPPPGDTGKGRETDGQAVPSEGKQNPATDGAQSRTFATHAPVFWRQGLSVVPLWNGEPVVADWAEYVDQLPPLAARARWLTEYGHCSVGLLLGTQLADGNFLGAVRAYDEVADRMQEAFPDAEAFFTRRHADGSLRYRIVFVEMPSPEVPEGLWNERTGKLLVEALGRGSYVEFGGGK